MVADLQSLQRDQHFAVVVTRPEVQATFPYQSDQPICVVMGSESEGTSPAIDAIADGVWSLPKYGKAESLNVAVSFGIFLSEVRREQQR
jgi:tRNA G18 (ribose-2'-O)-methylase SpoU